MPGDGLWSVDRGNGWSVAWSVGWFVGRQISAVGTVIFIKHLYKTQFLFSEALWCSLKKISCLRCAVALISVKQKSKIWNLVFRHSLVCHLSERALVGRAIVCPLTDNLSCCTFLLPVHAASKKLL